MPHKTSNAWQFDNAALCSNPKLPIDREMDSFVARQAIFDRDLNVWRYELLFRSGFSDQYDAQDGDSATVSVIANSLFEPGFEKLLHGRKATVNFDRSLLVSELCRDLPLPPDTVIEVLETVEPDDEVLAACRSLRERGYLIALDDYTGDLRLDPLLDVADLLKIDVLAIPPGLQLDILQRARARGILTIAEKVETREEWERARDAGYDYFQGFFFAEPVVLAAQQIPATTHSALSLIREMQAPDLDFGRVEELIKREVGFSHRLLRYLNSPIFHFPSPVSSIRQALVLLGEREIRRWVTLASFSRLGSGKPLELVTQSMVRGRFCEMVGRESGLPPNVDAFLLGVFSLLPALLDRPMAQLLDELALAPELSAPLRGSAPPDDRLAEILRLARAWESGDWEAVRSITAALEISTVAVGQAYIEAVYWADSIAAESAGPGWRPANSAGPARAPVTASHARPSAEGCQPGLKPWHFTCIHILGWYVKLSVRI